MSCWTPETVELRLRANRWFARQPVDVRNGLASRGTVIRFQTGQWIHSEGDTPAGLIAILSGSVRLEAAIGQARSILVGIVGQNAVLGQSVSFGGGPRLISARAAEISSLLMVSDRSLQSISVDVPAVWRSISELQYVQMEQTVRGHAMALSLTPRARIAAALMRLPSTSKSQKLKISQSDLAELSGMSRKAVNGHLQALQSDDLILISYRGIQILDRRRLKALAVTRTTL